MKNINPSAIAPIVAALFLAIEFVTGHKFNHDLQDTISIYVAALFTFGITVWGIIKNHLKEDKSVKTVALEIEEIAKAVEDAVNNVFKNQTETEKLNEATMKTNVVNAGEGDAE